MERATKKHEAAFSDFTSHFKRLYLFISNCSITFFLICNLRLYVYFWPFCGLKEKQLKAFCLVRVRVTVSHTLPYSFIWSKLYILLFMTVVCVCAPFLTRKWFVAWKFCLNAQLPSGLCVGAKDIHMNRHTLHASSKRINPKWISKTENSHSSVFCKNQLEEWFYVNVSLWC